MNDQQLAWLEKNEITTAEWKTLNSSLFPGARPESLVLYMNYCRARKLDPMKKPAHIVPMSVKDAQTGKYEWRDVVMPGIYEYRTTAARTGRYAGQDDVVFGEDIELDGNIYGRGGQIVPLFAKVTVYRIVEGIRCPFTGTAYFTETCATKKDGGLNAMWSKRPRGQLAKCAEADALRKAFPDELGGEMTIEEMEGRTIEDSTVSGVKVYTDDQYQDFLDLIDGKQPLAYFVFISSLDQEQAVAVQMDYKSSIERGGKGKEMERLQGVYNQGQATMQAVIETVENSEDDSEVLESWDELSSAEREYIFEELTPAGQSRILDLQTNEAA